MPFWIEIDGEECAITVKPRNSDSFILFKLQDNQRKKRKENRQNFNHERVPSQYQLIYSGLLLRILSSGQMS